MHGTQDRVARRLLGVMAAVVLLAGPVALSRGAVDAAASYDGFIFVPLALSGGAFGLLRAMRRPPAPRE